MAVLLDNQHLRAVWGAHQHFITGLDPLGLQNASEALYTRLLPGLTNLTNRIRYYGFYCWLLQQYAESERHTDPKEQYRYLRRAELMLAIIMQHEEPDFTQVTGSYFAGKLLAHNTTVFDLVTNADKDSGKDTYWKYPSGAFGQYYLGAMRDMGLVGKNTSDNFIPTPAREGHQLSGVQLSEAFADSIPSKLARLFLDNIKGGALQGADIPALGQAFGLHRIPPGSSEAALYQDLLLQADQARWRPREETLSEVHTYFRRDTLRYLLRLVQQAPEAANDRPDLPWQAYQDQALHPDEAHLQLWYFYQLNELWQYAMGTLFWYVLQGLESERDGVPIGAFVQSCVNELSSQEGFEAEISLGARMEQQQDAAATELANIRTAISGKQPTAAAQAALRLILGLCRVHASASPRLRELALHYGVLRNGRLNVLDFMDQLQPKLVQAYPSFLSDLLHQHIIHRHLYVAYRKMGNGVQSTEKLVLEEHRLRHIQTFPPRFTSPRLGALYHMLQDLHWVSTDHQLTDQGRQLLQNEALWS